MAVAFFYIIDALISMDFFFKDVVYANVGEGFDRVKCPLW